MFSLKMMHCTVFCFYICRVGLAPQQINRSSLGCRRGSGECVPVCRTHMGMPCRTPTHARTLRCLPAYALPAQTPLVHVCVCVCACCVCVCGGVRCGSWVWEWGGFCGEMCRNSCRIFHIPPKTPHPRPTHMDRRALRR